MKRSVFLSSLVVLIFTTMFLLTACGDDDETGSIKLNKSSILVASKGESESIEINASDVWEVRNIPNWITVTPITGENIAQVVIVVDRNQESERRKASITFVCGDAIQVLEVEQLSSTEEDNSLTLSESDLGVTNLADSKMIKVNSTHDWKLESLPTWIHSDKMSGTGNDEITLSIDENIEPKGRSATLTFTSVNNLSVILNLSQTGLEDVLINPILPIFTYSTIHSTDKRNFYDLEMTSVFINPSIKDKVFLGSLISPTWDTNTNIPTFAGYTFNPIVVFTSAIISGDIERTFTPSLSEQTTFANYIVEKKPQQGELFRADNGTKQFYSHKDLYAIGMVNMGIKLDELISGSSYLQAEMSKKYGLIFSFKSILFSLDMENPENLIKENLKAEDKTRGVSYVSRISYGKIGLLVVESDTYYSEVRVAINKVISGQTLTSEESNYITSSDINYVYFDSNNQPQVIKGGTDAINAYKKSMSSLVSGIYPLEFSLTDYSIYDWSTISFTTKIP